MAFFFMIIASLLAVPASSGRSENNMVHFSVLRDHFQKVGTAPDFKGEISQNGKTRRFKETNGVVAFEDDDSLVEGRAHLQYDDGKREYDGEFSHGVRSGLGKETTESDTYEGQWQNGQRNGQGHSESVDGSTYDGAWADGKEDGLGHAKLAGKAVIYEGEFKDGKRIGYGRYEGKWGDSTETERLGEAEEEAKPTDFEEEVLPKKDLKEEEAKPTEWYEPEGGWPKEVLPKEPKWVEENDFEEEVPPKESTVEAVPAQQTLVAASGPTPDATVTDEHLTASEGNEEEVAAGSSTDTDQQPPATEPEGGDDTTKEEDKDETSTPTPDAAEGTEEEVAAGSSTTTDQQPPATEPEGGDDTTKEEDKEETSTRTPDAAGTDEQRTASEGSEDQVAAGGPVAEGQQPATESEGGKDVKKDVQEDEISTQDVDGDTDPSTLCREEKSDELRNVCCTDSCDKLRKSAKTMGKKYDSMCPFKCMNAED